MVKISINDINKLYLIFDSGKSDKRKVFLFVEYILLNKIDLMSYEMTPFNVKYNEKYKEILFQCSILKASKLFDQYIFSDEDISSLLNNYMDIYNIIMSDESDILKARRLAFLDVSSVKFKSNFYILSLFVDYDKRLEKYKNILGDYQFIYDKIVEFEKTGLIKEGKRLNRENSKEFLIAKECILGYINTPNAISIEQYIIDNNLTNVLFNDYVSLVKEIDFELYNAFIKKKEYNEKVLLNNAIDTVRDLYRLIVSEESITPLEFIKRFPYCVKKDCNVFLLANKFVKKYVPECYDVILKYCIDNNLTICKFSVDNDKFNIRNFYCISIIVDGYELNDYDKDFIVNYMKDYNIPLFKIFYHVVRDAYLSGELDDEKKKKFN